MQINCHSVTKVVAPTATRWRHPSSQPHQNPQSWGRGGQLLRAGSVSSLVECLLCRLGVEASVLYRLWMGLCATESL